VSAALQSDINAEVEAMLKEGVIQPSQSNWAAPVLLVRKKDVRWRFCIDYHKLNKVTKKDSYPMSNSNKGLDSLGGSKFRRSKWQLAAANGAWSIRDGSFCDQAWTVQASGYALWTDQCTSYISMDDG